MNHFTRHATPVEAAALRRVLREIEKAERAEAERPEVRR